MIDSLKRIPFLTMSSGLDWGGGWWQLCSSFGSKKRKTIFHQAKIYMYKVRCSCVTTLVFTSFYLTNNQILFPKKQLLKVSCKLCCYITKCLLVNFFQNVNFWFFSINVFSGSDCKFTQLLKYPDIIFWIEFHCKYTSLNVL